MAGIIPCQGKHREFGDFVKTQEKHRDITNNMCSSGKCSDSKSKGHSDICRKEISSFPQNLDRSAKSVLCM